ncbi:MULTISPECIES: uroporphyrinogen-III synthase [unclassified Saccharopolyspora]|uniref:uroporphyrinogen-III synthase n=1 Tax=unclassified Saccharopolyspora TaxID=2646250 RepID=UPI001CD1B3F8|nr:MULTISPECIES: uroporphyrinogen-III synthase [unclassified Saccharopolyspora]MCA1185504.1 uroporphyrinogen-III synthase [Saccharopolyspora sp. 6T]MCA1192273.1 uroporphyrinogen-III synthase [Saccharopolyspora sp. 6V]MCA1225155.1 uroporphyrinogen-III synthase [Saccharopolyspora sp. 6M]MCA1279606.1 uroporphyrinogen-III synthase [Saccharopolyspora sp. 7B]
MAEDVEDTEPLRGFTAGITAERKAAELGALLARRGARVRYGAAMHTVPVGDDAELTAATEAVLARPVQHVVAVTGSGFGGWIESARARGAGERLLAHLGSAELLARGAKARGAIRGAGLRESYTAPTEEVADVLDRLLAQGVAGARVVVQLHGDPMTDFRERLRAAGAEVLPIVVYRWTDPVDLGPLDALIDAVIDGEVRVLPLTSAPAATNFLARARRTGRGEALLAALRTNVLIACVGPVTAAPIAREDLPHVLPERARTAALVRLIADEAPRFARGDG